MKLKFTCLLLACCVAGLLAAGCSRAAKKNRHLQRANAQFKAGNYDHAEIEYLNTLRFDPTNQTAIRNLGLMAYEGGRVLRAFGLLSKARELAPDDLELRLHWGDCLFETGQLTNAHKEALFVLERQPTNSEALLLLVKSSVTTNELNQARQRIEKLAASAGNTPGFHLAQGTLRLRAGDLPGATASFQQAIKVDPKCSGAHAALGNLLVLSNDLSQAEAHFLAAATSAPPRSIFRLRYPDFKIVKGDTAAGRQALEEIVKQTPDYLPASQRLASLAFAERRFADCDGILKSILKRDPPNLDALLLVPQLRLSQGEPARAVAALEEVLKIYPRLPLVHYRLGVANLANNDLSSAVKSLQSALLLQPEFPEATLLLAELNVRKGDTAAAISSLSKLVAQRPRLTQAQLLLATAYRAARKPELALKIYDNLSRAFPTNPEPAFLTGLVLAQEKRTAEARKSFEHALALSSNSVVAVEQLINLDLTEKNYAAAQQRAQAELNRTPTNTNPYLLLAKVQLAQTNLAGAESILLKALEFAPTSRAVNTMLAGIYVKSRKHEDALKKLNEMVARNTNDLTSWLQIAELHSAASNYVAAREAYEKVLAVNPRSGAALNNFAWLAAEHLGDLKLAYELGSRARDLEPNNPFAADTFGWILYHNGDYARALALIEQSSRALPHEPEVLFHLGMTHYMMGEEAAARLALQNAAQLAGADAKWLPQARERLHVLEIDPARADAAVLQELKTLSASAPNDPMLLAKLAAVAERNGDWDRAAKSYEASLALNTNLVPVMVSLAQLYSAHLKDPARAFALARRARSLEPNDPEIAHTLGRLAYAAASSTPDFLWAYGLLQESARSSPEDPDVQFDFAQAAYAIGQITNAVLTMQKLAAAGAASAHQDEARLFLEMNSLSTKPASIPSAATRIQEVLQKQPDYLPALVVFARSQELKGDFAGARDTYERILKRAPRFSPAEKALASIYLDRLPDPKLAYEHATTAREAFPQDPAVARILGILALDRGEIPRAVQLLTECASSFPADAELFYRLGTAQFQLKQSKQSRESLTKALALAPNSPWATDAKRLLQELK